MKIASSFSIAICVAFAILTAPETLRAEDRGTKEYLSGEKLLLIGAGSTAPLILNYAVRHIDSNQASLLPRPILADDWFARKIGGDFYIGKKNFLSGKSGSAITAGFCGVALLAANFTWPEGRSGKDAGQDFFLFHSGLMATKGVTGIFKGLVARPRPFLYYHPDSAVQHDDKFSDSRRSFFSGHASSAFYSSVYLNKRLREIMRQRLSGEDYSNWRWAPPAILFGWSGFVGLSRIQAYDHYFSDVVVGAVAGYLLAELFFRFGDNYSSNGGSAERISPIFHLSFSF